ncbi:unnamed protein product [Meloidogyne enterolobii]|uniref:Uncharacterized protein n=1 Tax=Meloidogyne enterolobii TaxID=390850 RepID=A0ACB0YAH4_MELEN
MSPNGGEGGGDEGRRPEVRQIVKMSPNGGARAEGPKCAKL